MAQHRAESASSQALPPVSIICVFNDDVVRRRCLDRSIDDHRQELPGVELIAIDNTAHTFSSAGAALNHGARLAANDILAFVHQDVYLHSLAALGAAARQLQDDPTIGLLGPVGISADQSIIGRTRDRITLIGTSAPSPVDVDSLDEVLFLASRQTLLDHPLSQAPELAWHAYAVEYGVRLRSLGLRVCALDIPLTHNSLTINLDKLDVAHAAVARLYPDALPVQTTCGTVQLESPAQRLPRRLRDQRWRLRWLKESFTARRLRRAAPGVPIVLSDIRQYVDVVLPAGSTTRVINIDTTSFGDQAGTEPLALQRLDKSITVITTGVDRLPAVSGTSETGNSCLVTNISMTDLPRVREMFSGRRLLLGLYDTDEIWLLAGPAVRGNVPQWRSRRARPLGTPRRPEPAARS